MVDPAVVKTQRELDGVAQQVEDLAATIGESAGYAAVEIDIPTRSVTVYWKGDADPALDVALGAAEAQGISSQVLPAAYNKAEMSAAVDALLGTGSDKETVDVRGGFRVHTVSEARDGSGVQAQVESRGRAADRELPARAQAALQARTTVRVTAEVHPPLVLTKTRWDDRSAWYAGGRWGPAGCSTGFGVTRLSDGKNQLLTAEHCGFLNTWHADPTGEIIGKSVRLQAKPRLADHRHH